MASEDSRANETIDEFLDRVDDVLSRAFPSIESDSAEPADPAPVDVEPKPWPVSERRQAQLERLGNPDNEPW